MAPAEPASANSDERLPRALGKYQLLRLVGRGGMGAVYEAEDGTLKRRVAIKLLPEAMARSPEAAKRFLLEAQAVARLNHPHVVTIYEVARHKDELFLAMEFIEGGSVADLLRQQRGLSWREATQIVLEASRGLVAAHEAKLIHRDIKPANLLRKSGGYIKLADFGLSKAVDRTGVSLTGSGQIVGTPHYMSPEQCRQDEVTEASDLYSMGATYFALLTGSPPFPGEQPMQVMFAHCGSPVPDPRTKFPDIPAACAEIVQRCLAKLPQDRFADAAELVRHLEAALAARTVDASHVHNTTLEPPPIATGANTMVLSANPATSSFPPLVAPPRTQRTKIRSGRRSPTVLLAGAVGAVVLLALLVWGVAQLRPQRTAATRPTPSQPPRVVESTSTAKTKTGSAPPVTALREQISTTASITALAFTSRNDALAIGEQGSQGRLRFRQLAKKADGPRIEVRSRLPAASDDDEAKASITTVAFSPDGKHLAIGVRGGAYNGTHLLQAAADGRWEATKDLFPMGPAMLCFAPQSPLLAAVYMQTRSASYVLAWRLPNALPADPQPRVPTPLKAAAILPGSPPVLVTGGRSGELLFCDLTNGEIETRLARQLVRALTVSPDGKWLAVGGAGTIELWNLAKGRVRERETLLAAEQIVFSPDSRWLFVAGGANSDASLRILDRDTLRVVMKRDEHTRTINALAISPDGKTLASGGDDQLLCVWDVERLVGEIATGPAP